MYDLKSPHTLSPSLAEISTCLMWVRWDGGLVPVLQDCLRIHFQIFHFCSHDNPKSLRSRHLGVHPPPQSPQKNAPLVELSIFGRLKVTGLFKSNFTFCLCQQS